MLKNVNVKNVKKSLKENQTHKNIEEMLNVKCYKMLMLKMLKNINVKNVLKKS